jgi:hypothetical protein
MIEKDRRQRNREKDRKKERERKDLRNSTHFVALEVVSTTMCFRAGQARERR